MRYAARKDANQGPIVEGLRAVGATVDILDGRGRPDLLVGYRGRNWLLEVKDPAQPPSARQLTPAQREWHAGWRGQKAVVETLEEALVVIGAVRRTA